jgi:hypothetical protein
MPRYTKHARDQMAARDIAEADVEHALSHRSGLPEPGSNGAIKVFGYAQGGRILKLVLTPDQEAIITLAWPDE